MKNYHFRRIPDHIEQELRNVQSQHIVIAAIVSASKLDIARRTYRHLGIRVDAGNLSFQRLSPPISWKAFMLVETATALFGFIRTCLKLSRLFLLILPTLATLPRVITPPTSTVRSISAPLSLLATGRLS